MKRILSFICGAAVLLSAVSCSPKYETVKGDALKTKVYTLDNGLKIFMSVNKEQPRIQTYIAVKVGSKNDPKETTGLAHYFEHLMFKGTEQFGTTDYAAEKPLLDKIEELFELYRVTKDEKERAKIYHRIDSVSYEASKIAIPNEYDKLMSLIGAQGTNAWTSTDETVYTEDIPSNQIDNWARIQADRFRNNVIRGFHTELETIYEEKNMSLTKDSRKILEALYKALFPNHPYGQQTTLGSQEHLKNPSITNVKKYHDTYYVPNNMAICVAGDFNPDEMVAIIKKYFGDWKAKPDVPTLEFEQEKPIGKPVVKEVYGLESESVALAWRLPGAGDLKVNAVGTIASSILYNGTAGLIDLDVNQQQKALFLYGAYHDMPDYSCFFMFGQAKEGQTLEEVKAIALEEIAKLAVGDFDENLISATINNLKLSLEKQLEGNNGRARAYVNAFINGIDWKDASKDIERCAAVTKEDVMAFAKKYLADNAYAVVYKRQGEDNTVQKISAPQITPIVSNRDSVSRFVKEIQAVAVKPIEPVFVDFAKDMAKFNLANGVDVLYKHKEINDIFELSYVFNTGTENDPELSLALDYLPYLGTPTMTAEQIAKRMYELACSFSVRAGTNQTSVSLSGLSANMPEAMRILEDIIQNAVADETILANCKSDIIKSRFDAKKKQSSCYSALSRYIIYGPEFIKKNTLSNAAIASLSSELLLSKVKDVYNKGHEILYYGPMSQEELRKAIVANHTIADGCEQLPEVQPVKKITSGNKVLLAQYDAKQIYYNQYSNRGEKFDPSEEAGIRLYNDYFGGGMNSIVFQEIREARGLAYSAWASLIVPKYLDDNYSYSTFVATQNDKMRQAIEAFAEIIEKMPESEAAFQISKESLISRMRTERVIGSDVLWQYRACRRLGLSEPLARSIFSEIQNCTLADVKAAQEKWVKNRDYTYGILGDIKDIDTKYLKTLGAVEIVTLEDIFGY